MPRPSESPRAQGSTLLPRLADFLAQTVEHPHGRGPTVNVQPHTCVLEEEDYPPKTELTWRNFSLREALLFGTSYKASRMRRR